MRRRVVVDRREGVVSRHRTKAKRRAAFRLYILGASEGARLEPKVRAMLRMSPEELRVLGAKLQAAVEARRDEIAGLS